MAEKSRDIKQESIHVDRPQSALQPEHDIPKFVVDVNEVQRGTHVEDFGIRYLSIFNLLNFSAIISEEKYYC